MLRSSNFQKIRPCPTEMRYKENHHGSMNLVDHRVCERRPASAKGNPWLRRSRSRSCTVAAYPSVSRNKPFTRKKHMNILQCPILRNRADYAKHIKPNLLPGTPIRYHGKLGSQLFTNVASWEVNSPRSSLVSAGSTSTKLWLLLSRINGNVWTATCFGTCNQSVSDL